MKSKVLGRLRSLYWMRKKARQMKEEKKSLEYVRNKKHQGENESAKWKLQLNCSQQKNT